LLSCPSCQLTGCIITKGSRLVKTKLSCTFAQWPVFRSSISATLSFQYIPFSAKEISHNKIKMHFTTLSLCLLVATVLAEAEPAPYPLGVMMSFNDAFSLMKRQTPGYQPGSYNCGQGATCVEACGPGQQQCASNDGQIHCYNPTVKQSCCSNGSGCEYFYNISYYVCSKN
jgi:hypothetical protein